MFSFFKKKNSQTHKLCYEVDLHSHILPGIDDGSPNTEKSIGLIREMQNWGIRKIIATPHIAEETFENTPETIKNAWDLLKATLKTEGIEQEICYSAEYRIDDGFIRMFESNQLIPLPDNYLLVENSFIQAKTEGFTHDHKSPGTGSDPAPERRLPHRGMHSGL